VNQPPRLAAGWDLFLISATAKSRESAKCRPNGAIALAELGSKAIRFVPFCGKRPRGSSPVSSCVKAAVEIG
jgi:hypothetical protein